MMNKEEEKFERYKLLINARNFHYENFNKWMTYYYVAIGALFVGYYTMKSGDKIDAFGEYSLMILGYIIGLFWYWSCKGYYYWNINFITLVNNYEKEILKYKDSERIYFVFANKKRQNNYLNPISGANVSTSKVTILFAFIVTVVWGVLFSYKLFETNNFFHDNLAIKIVIIIAISIVSVLLISWKIPKWFLKSKNDHFPDLKINQ